MTSKRPPKERPAEEELSLYAQAKAEAKKKALRALKRAKHVAIRNNVELSEWEGEFLSTVAERIETYGRAFADPDKGAMEAPLSLMQGVKLREITKKARGDKQKTVAAQSGVDPEAEAEAEALKDEPVSVPYGSRPRSRFSRKMRS